MGEAGFEPRAVCMLDQQYTTELYVPNSVHVSCGAAWTTLGDPPPRAGENHLLGLRAVDPLVAAVPKSENVNGCRWAKLFNLLWE